MRTPSSDIHQLIHSLSKEEQKRVTIHLKELGRIGEKYLQLFKAIKKQETYKERALKQKFQGNVFSNLKKRLYNLVLETLTQLHQDTDVHHKVLTGLQRFQVLYKRELYDQAYQELIKVKELSDTYELLYYKQIVYDRMLELEHRVYQFRSHTRTSLEEWMSEIKENKEQVANLTDYFLLQAELYCCFYKNRFTEKEALQVKQIMEKPLFESEERAKSIYAKALYFNMKMIYYNSTNENSKALTCSLEVLRLYEENFKKGHPNLSYIILICNVLGNAIYESDALVVEELFMKIEASKTEIIDKDIYQLMVLEFKMSWYRELGDIVRATALEKEWSNWLLASNLDLSIIYFYFAVIAFLRERYDEAIQFLDYPLDNKRNTKFKDLQNLGRLFLLVIYFEQEEFSLMEKMTRSLYRSLEMEAKSYTLEWTILKYFKRLLNAEPGMNTIIFKELEEELYLTKKVATRDQGLVLNIFHLMKWVTYKANEKNTSESFYQVVFKNTSSLF